MAEINQPRILGEGDIVVLELSGRALSEIDRQCVCHIQSGHITASDSAGHTAASVCDNDGITASVHGIGKGLPKSLQRLIQSLNGRTPSTIGVPMYDVVGEEGGGVDLSLALFQLGKEVAAALFVMT